MGGSFINRLGSSPEEGIKAPVVVVTKVNVVLAGAQIIDGLQTVAGDRVLVRLQTDLTENGIYDVSDTAWSRTTDFDAANDVVRGVLVLSSKDSNLYQASFDGAWNPGVTELSFIFINLSGAISSGEANTSSSPGAAGQALTMSKNGVNLPFKKLIAGDNITFNVASDGLTINGEAGGAAPGGDFVLREGDTMYGPLTWFDPGETLKQIEVIYNVPGANGFRIFNPAGDNVDVAMFTDASGGNLLIDQAGTFGFTDALADLGDYRFIMQANGGTERKLVLGNPWPTNAATSGYNHLQLHMERDEQNTTPFMEAYTDDGITRTLQMLIGGKGGAIFSGVIETRNFEDTDGFTYGFYTTENVAGLDGAGVWQPVKSVEDNDDATTAEWYSSDYIIRTCPAGGGGVFPGGVNPNLKEFRFKGDGSFHTHSYIYGHSDGAGAGGLSIEDNTNPGQWYSLACTAASGTPGIDAALVITPQWVDENNVVQTNGGEVIIQSSASAAATDYNFKFGRFGILELPNRALFPFDGSSRGLSWGDPDSVTDAHIIVQSGYAMELKAANLPLLFETINGVRWSMGTDGQMHNPSHVYAHAGDGLAGPIGGGFSVEDNTNAGQWYSITATAASGAAGIDAALVITPQWIDANNVIQTNGGEVIIQTSTNAGSTKNFWFQQDGDLEIAKNCRAIAFVNTSDERLKDNLRPADEHVAVNLLYQNLAKQFDWKDGGAAAWGFSAQEIAANIDNITFTSNSDGMLGVDYSKMVPYLWAQNQAQQARLDALEARLEAAGL